MAESLELFSKPCVDTFSSRKQHASRSNVESICAPLTVLGVGGGDEERDDDVIMAPSNEPLLSVWMSPMKSTKLIRSLVRSRPNFSKTSSVTFRAIFPFRPTCSHTRSNCSWFRKLLVARPMSVHTSCRLCDRFSKSRLPMRIVSLCFCMRGGNMVHGACNMIGGLGIRYGDAKCMWWIW